MKGIDYNKLGKRVRHYRKAAGLTQQQVAETLELEPSNMSHIERGTIKTSLGTLTGIANILGVTLDALVCDSLEYAAAPYQQELSSLFGDCTARELRILSATVKALKRELRQDK